MLKAKPRILFIRAGALGDVLLISPLIRRCFTVRKGDCEIYVKTFYPELFRDNPYVTQSFRSDNLSSNEFDIVYNLDWVYEKNNDRHVLDAYEEYVFGNTSLDRYCELFDSIDDTKYVDSLVAGIDDFIILHMRNIANTDIDQMSRNINEDIWKLVVIDILNQSNSKIIQIGSAGDLSFGGSDRLIDMRQCFSIHQIKSLCERAKCFLGVDSGPAHIAATSSVGMVVLYTIAKVDDRIPFRKHGITCTIKADIECQGCLVNIAPGQRLNCPNNVQCRNSFSPQVISKNVLDMINKPILSNFMN